MAYYYFDSDDHITTLHNADIYLLANVGNYHDYNGEIKSFAGFYLTGNKTFTVGGNYDITGLQKVYNINQRYSGKKNKDNKVFAAVGFGGNGEFNISSQIGAPDGKKHDDRNVTISAYIFLSNDKSSQCSVKDWDQYYGKRDGAMTEAFTVKGKNFELTQGKNVSYNSDYNFTGQVSDISGIYAADVLTVASHYNGYIKVQGFHESIGMKDANDAINNTAMGTSTISSGLRGNNDIRFNGSFFGNIHATARVHFQNAAAKLMNDNTIGAYGVYSQQNITQNNVHAGSIYAVANKNYLDASISDVSSDGTMINNTITAAGLRAPTVHLKTLDSQINNTHAASNNIMIVDDEATFTWTGIEISGQDYTDNTGRIATAVIEDNDTNYFYYVEVPSMMQMNVDIGKFTHLQCSDVEIPGTITEITLPGDLQKTTVLKINPDECDEDTFDLFKTVCETGSEEDLMLWRMDGTAYSTIDYVVKPRLGRISYSDPDYEDVNFSTVTWDSNNNDADVFILNIDGNYIRIENGPAVRKNGNSCSYTFTEEDVAKYPSLDLSALEYTGKTVEGYYEYKNDGSLRYFNQQNGYNSGKFSFVTTANNIPSISEFGYDLTPGPNNTNQTNVQNTIGTNLTDYVIETGRVNIAGTGGSPDLMIYEFSTKENEIFNVYKDWDYDVVIRSEANGNIFKATSDTNSPHTIIYDNIIQAIGVYGENTLTIDNFTEGSVIEVIASDNEIYEDTDAGPKSDIRDNQINAIGIYGNTVNLKDFYGTINVEGFDNYMDLPPKNGAKNIYTFSGIRALNLNVDRNLHGNITVNTDMSEIEDVWYVGKTDRNNQFGGTQDIYNSTYHSSAIFANNMNIDGFIKTNITVNVSHNVIGAGVYAENILDAKGFSGNVNIFAGSLVGNTFGIYAKTFESDLGYYYTFLGADANNDYGDNSAMNKTVVALDTFTVEGSIVISGIAQHHGIATRDTANIYLNGTLVSALSYNNITDTSLQNLYTMALLPSICDAAFAVKTDFGNDVKSGFHNDIIQLGSNATVFGIIDMGGGNNNITFDDDSRFFGYIFHDNGKINITYSINDEQGRTGDVNNYAIHTVNDICDATLSSGTTITVDCNNIIVGEEYRLIHYIGTTTAGTSEPEDSVIDLADARWKNGAITISYMGESRLIYLNNNQGIGQIEAANGESLYVKVNYNTTNHTLSVKALSAAEAAADPVAKENNIVTVSIDTRIETLKDEHGADILDENGNPIQVENEYLTFNNPEKTMPELIAMQNAFAGYTANKDYVVYEKDANTYSATASSTLYWMCDVDDYLHSAYEITYDIVDANGNNVSHALLRLNTVDGNKETFSGNIELDDYKKLPVTGKINLVNAAGQTYDEWQKNAPTGSIFVGAYYIMSYEIDKIPEGCTVEYKVRDYSGDGFEISPWVEAEITTKEQEFPAFVADNNKNYMVVLNPDDDTRLVGSAIGLFTWRAVASNYPIDHYNIQYFSSTEDLSGDTARRTAIFEAYEAADLSVNMQDRWQTNKATYVDENGNTQSIDIYIGSNGEIQLRDKKEEIRLSDGSTASIYNYYSFVSKNVSGTELLASGLANQSYIYWRVQATDVLGTINNYVEGSDFRIFLGDTEGPAFIESTNLDYNRTLEYIPAENKFLIENFTWGGVLADDEKSGVRYYIIEASLKDQNQWTEVYSIGNYELENGVTNFDFDLDPGIYDVRVRPVDAAGNNGTPSSKLTIYAIDNIAPSCTVDAPVGTKWIIGEGDAAQHIGWSYNYTFDRAVDPVSTNGTFQSTGVDNYTISVYYTTESGERTNVEWELYGVINNGDGTFSYERIEDVNYTNNTFAYDAYNYSSYQIRTPNMTYFSLDNRDNPIIDAETGFFIYNGRDYHINIKVSDKIGNVNTVLDERIDVSPEASDDDESNTNPPSGQFLSISNAEITATHKIIEREETTGEGENQETVTVTEIGEIEKVTATFSWQDNFTSPNDVYYLMQFSDSAFFDTATTYTLLVTPSTLSIAEQEAIYNAVSENGNYPNLRIYSVDTAPPANNENNNNQENQTPASGEIWRQNGITTIVMDNMQPTASVGMLSQKGTTYWQVKSIDRLGNENNFSAVQSLEFKSDVNGQKIVEHGKALAPYDIEVEVGRNNESLISVNGEKLYKNSGALNIAFSISNTSTLLGYNYIVIDCTSKNGGNTFSEEIYRLFPINHGGSSFTEVSGSLLNAMNQNLREGDYTITIKAYDYNGKYAQSEKYNFVQDLTRPFIKESTAGIGNNRVNSTIKVAFDKPQDETESRILTTVSWPLALDDYGIKGYVLSYRCKEINENWQKVYVNDSEILKTNSCQITLYKDMAYDFAVYAIDNNDNYSTEVKVENIIISYKDIDDGIADDNPLYTPGSTGPIHIYSQLIGGGDAIDNIYVSTLKPDPVEDPTPPGEIQITIANLQKISGSGNSIIIDVYQDNGGEIKVGSFTFALNNQTKSSSGYTVKYMVQDSGSDYRFEVRSANANTIMQYDLHYAFDWFETTNDNNTAFQANVNNRTVNFDTAVDDNSVFIGGEPTLNTPYVNRVGYGDPNNYTILQIGTEGMYSFTASKGATDSLSALTITIYQMKPGATTLTTVKSFSVAAGKEENTLKDLKLSAGEYVIQVNSTSAAKGANVRYNLEVSTSDEKYFTKIDNTDDVFLNEKTLVEPVDSESTQEIQYVFNSMIGSNATYEYIGIGDSVDFRKINIDEAGKYTFTLDKNVLPDEDGKLYANSMDGALTMTIYKMQDGKIALTKLSSVTVNAKTYTRELSAFLDEGEYYIEVKSTAPTKTALDYMVTVEADTFEAGESMTIIDHKPTASLNNNNMVYINSDNRKTTYDYIGFGEDKNYLEVNLSCEGAVTFTLNRSQRTKGTDYSALKANIYKTNKTGEGFTLVKSVNLKNSDYSAAATINNLAAGQYVIEVIASDAAKGKYAEYNVSVNATKVETATFEAINYINAENVDLTYTRLYNRNQIYTDTLNAVTQVIEQGHNFYRFNTGDYAGAYSFENIDNLYYLKDGSVNLTKVKLNSNTAYLEANTTYFVATTPSSTPETVEVFRITAPEVVRIADTSLDNDFTNLTSANIFELSSANTQESYTSWVGFDDLESWSKLELEQGGSFNLALDNSYLNENNEEIFSAFKSAMTVTVYQMAPNGISLKSVGNFSVKAGATEGMKNFLLNAGEYYIQVKTTNTQADQYFTLNIDGQDAGFIAQVDPGNNTALTDSTINITPDNTAVVNNWVGFTDEYDYFNINVSESGYYDFAFGNSDAAQVTLYIVNPTNSRLTALATYTAKNATGYTENEGTMVLNVDRIFADKAGNGLLLDSNSQYIAMVKSTNAAKGGNCDYNLSISNKVEGDLYVEKFEIATGTNGKYTFTGATDDFELLKYNNTTGKTSAVKLTNDTATLAAGEYFIVSDVRIDDAIVDPNMKEIEIITIA